MIKGIIAGAFDVYHPGYVQMLKEAKSQCDCLIIMLHTDPSKERPEKLKPILTVKASLFSSKIKSSKNEEHPS